jgi:hypothetical protein
MAHQSASLALPMPEAAGAALLGARPAVWLRPFLRLAVAGVPTGRVAVTAPWFRLGPLEINRAGASASLVWWPHAGPHVFTRFRGMVRLRGDGDGVTILTIEGDCEGGDNTVNATVVERLTSLLVAALSELHGQG